MESTLVNPVGTNPRVGFLGDRFTEEEGEG